MTCEMRNAALLRETDEGQSIAVARRLGKFSNSMADPREHARRSFSISHHLHACRAPGVDALNT